MLYKILADIVLISHFLWILFLMFGVLLGVRIKWARTVHLSALGFSILLQLNGWICPLTHLEFWLRGKAGYNYRGGFIEHYVEKLVYLEVKPEYIFAATIVVVAVTLWLYFSAFLREKRNFHKDRQDI